MSRTLLRLILILASASAFTLTGLVICQKGSLLHEGEAAAQPAKLVDSLPVDPVPVPSETERESVAEMVAREVRESAAYRANIIAKAKQAFAEAEATQGVRRRKVRRFVWESPAETRGKLWNVPETEGEEATLTAFLRVCMSEADGHPQDCVGIWQVIKNIRRRECERGAVRRITECEDGGGETLLSVLRRAQPHILEAPGYALRNQRAGWIRNMTTECTTPEGWTGTDDQWDARNQGRCQHAVELGRYLIKGELPPARPGHRLVWLSGRPITWGGRCENKRGSCDDRIACARGLARINQDATHNAFWRRPTSPDEVDPVCVQLGYGAPSGVVAVASQ